MTLCIAAIAWEQEKLVAVHDYLLSLSDLSMSMEASAKLAPIARTWFAMYAGDPTAATSITRRAVKTLGGEGETAETVEAAWQGAFKEELWKKIEDELLSHYAMTLDDFKASGLKVFGETEFRRILYEVERTNLDTEFIIAGFDKQGRPGLFSVGDPGVRHRHVLTGFHAIGNGATLAQSSLMSSLDVNAPLTDVVYRVAEAKFVGEIAPGVGRRTRIYTFDKNGKCETIDPNKTENIKKLWQEKGRPPVPKEAASLISSSLKGWKWS